MGWSRPEQKALMGNGWRALVDGGESGFRKWAASKMTSDQAEQMLAWAKRNHTAEVAQQRAIELAEASARMASEGLSETGQLHVTYLKLKESRGKIVVYSGYSHQGKGQLTPREVVAARNSGHSRNAEGFGPSILDKYSGSLDVAKGREQMLIEHFEELGIRAKQIAGTAAKEPEYLPRLAAAKSTFGVVPYTEADMRRLLSFQKSSGMIGSVEEALGLLG